MVESGELSLGVPCVPYRMMKFTTKDGELEKVELNIIGRKFPLHEIRKQLLARHETYMRLNTDDEIDSMSVDDMQSLSYHHPVLPDTPTRYY